MNYPFLYKVIGQVDVQELRATLVKGAQNLPVWDDWVLEDYESTFVRNYVDKNFFGLQFFLNKIYISSGFKSNFHIDRYHYFHLMHRVLIPLVSNFHYEWIVNEAIVQFAPRAGDIIILNNMIPHRFVSNQNENIKREVLLFDLIDPASEKYLKFLDGNNSEQNANINKKYAVLSS